MSADDPTATRFVQTDAFDVSTVVAADAGDGCVAVADADGRVDLVSDGNRSLVARRDDVRDVAVADRVYVLAGGDLEAFSHAGSRVWGMEAPGGRSVDADPVTDRVFVRSADGEFRGIEGRTGVESRRFEQPHAEVAESPAVAVYDGRLAVASWSFLTVLDAEGERLWEATLSGAVTDVGLLPGRAVVSLKDGQFAGYEGPDRAWSVDGAADWLADAGVRRVVGRVDGDLVGIDADGDRRPLDGVTGDPVAATLDCGTLCTLGSGTLTVYSAVGEADGAVSVAVPTDSVRRRDPTVTLELTNDGDAAVEADVRVDVEGASVVTSRIPVTIGAGATQRRRIALSSVTADELDVSASVDGATATATVEVAEESTALTAEAEYDAVESGVLSVGVVVTNDGETPLSGVTVGETRVGDLPVGDSERVAVERDLPSGPVEVRADGVDPVTADLSVPATPTGIDLAADDGFLVVTLANDTPVPVSDELRVEGVPASGDRSARSVSIPANGGYRLVLPVTESGERPVTVETAGGHVSERLALTRWSRLPDPAATPARTPAEGATTTDTAPAANAGFGGADGGTADGDPSGPVDAERTLVDGPAPCGTAFTEELSVSNRSDERVVVEVATDDGSYRRRIALPPEGTATGTRYHVGFDSSVTLPEVTLGGDWGATALPPERHRIDEPGLLPRLTWRERDDADAELTFVLTNTDDRATWAVTDVLFEHDVDVGLDVTLAPGETASGTVPMTGPPDDRVAQAIVRARRSGGESDADPDPDERTLRTLVPHDSLVEAALSMVSNLSVEVAPRSRVEDGLGSLFLSVGNDGDEAVPGLRIAATGDAVEKTIYSEGADGDDLDPEGTVTYIVDLEGVPPGGSVEVDLELAASDGGSKRLAVAADADEDACVPSGEWTLDVREEHDVAFPPRVSTPYE